MNEELNNNIAEEKILTTNGMIHGTGILATVSNILANGHQFIMSETVTEESILQGYHESKV